MRRLVLALLALIVVAGCGDEQTAPKRVAGERHLVFARGPSAETAQVWIADVDGTHARKLTSGTSGVITPNGRTVAVGRPKTGIYLVPSAGGQPKLLTSKPLSPIAWSGDGKWLVAATAATLARINRSTGDVRIIARGPIYGADVSPAGDELVYARAPHSSFRGLCGDQVDLYTTGFGGEKPTRITKDGLSAFPVWGPDGQIAFSHFPGTSMEDCRAPGVWTVKTDGSDPQTILDRAPQDTSFEGSGFYGLQPVAWRQDGQVLVGIRGDYKNAAAILDTGSHKLRRLAGFADKSSFDGAYLVGGDFETGNVSITRVSDAKRQLVKDACCPDWNR
jgi:Tol biopolymer transport system component